MDEFINRSDSWIGMLDSIEGRINTETEIFKCCGAGCQI
jgi:hypothetical protein